MSRTAKTTTLILSFLLLLFVIGAITLLTLLDPNRFKAPIIHQIEQSIGRQVTIEGDLSWSFLPTLGIHVDDIAVANPEGFSKKDFLHIDSLDVRVKIVPLLKKHVELGKIILHAPTLNLMRNAKGETNWVFTSKAPATKPLAPAASFSEPSSRPSSRAPITLGGLKISAAVIHWDDAINQQVATVTIPSLQLKSFTQGQPTHVRFAFKAQSHQPHWVAQGKVNSTVLFSPYDIQFHALTYTSKATHEPDGLGAVELNIQTDKLIYNWTTHAIHTGSLQGNLANMPFTALLRGTLGSKPALQGDLRVPTFNVSKWLTHFGFSNPLQPDQASANLSLTVQNNRWKIAPFNLILDKMHMQGAMDYDSNQGLVDFNLKANTLDLNELKKPKEAKPIEKAKALLTQKKAKPTVNLMGQWLQRHTLKGQVTIDTLRIGPMMAQHVHTLLQGAKGQIQSATSANFYQGLVKGTLVADFNHKEPRYHLEENVQDVQVQSLFRALDVKKALTGTGSLTASLTTQGNTMDQIQRQLNGSINLRLLNGTIEGLNLVKLLKQAANVALKGGKLLTGHLQGSQSSSHREDTDFSSLTASWTIKDGVASNNDLLFQSRLLKGTGHGTVNVVNGGLHYYLALQTVAGQLPAVDQLEKLMGGAITIKFGCTLMEPCRELKVDIDPEAFMQSMSDLLKAGGKKPLRSALKNLKLPPLFN